MEFSRQTTGRINRLVAFVAICVVAIAISASGSPAAANAKYAGIVVDAKTGKVLYSSNADARRYPASLTKVMTLYILFEEIEAGRLREDSRLKVSANAAAQPPTKLGLKPGSTIRVRDAMRALAVKSANDAAVVVAEAISGSEAEFARRMTRTARALGMKSTTFKNASGLPNSGQVTTARDMAILGRAVEQHFPGHYKVFSMRTFSWGKKSYRNHNRLLGRVKGVDGIKTGYTRASGYNLITSVRHNNRHTVSVVLGGRTSARRNAHMTDLVRRYHNKARRGGADAPILAAGPVRKPPLPKARPAGLAVATITQSVTPQKPRLATGGPIQLAAAAYGRPASKPSNPAVDAIADRILAASQAAALAYPDGEGEGDGDSLPADLTRLADKRYPQRARPAESTAAKPIRGGWQIQVAAVPTETGAISVLKQVQAKAGDLLNAADPFTQPVDNNGARLYRARFAGFSGKSEARAICRKLKRKSVTCLAVPG